MADVATSQSTADPVLAELMDEITEKLQAGEPFDFEAYASDHSEYAPQLRELLPALKLLADLGQLRIAGGSLSPQAAREPSPPFLGDVPSHQVGTKESVPQSASGPVLGALGDFSIVREIGRGGMGIVYEAEQISLRRRVALKVLPFAAVLDPRRLQRFKNEAPAAASLDHPNIVQVYSVGCERGIHYFAMQYIEGQTLAQIISDLRQAGHVSQWLESERPKAAEPLSSPSRSQDGSGSEDGDSPKVPGRGEPENGAKMSADATARPTLSDTERQPQAGISTDVSNRGRELFRSAANLAIQAAEALEHAHQMGIVHRDIKPSNLMVDVTGHLRIADFGLAHSQEDVNITMSGDVLGTLRYMSPEQAAGKSRALDHHTDIYSLGVTLYELLTQKPAFPGDDRHKLTHQIIEGDFRPPRQFNPSIPRDLETVVLKATATEPEARYETAQELAEDLQRFLDDKPIAARRPSMLERAWKWSLRHRPAVAAAAVLLVIAAVVGPLIGAHQIALRRLADGRAQQLEVAKNRAAKEAETARNMAAAADATNEFLINDLLGQAHPENEADREITLRAVLDRASAKIEGRFQRQPLVAAAIRETIAKSYLSLGEYAEAERLFERAREILCRELGPEHPAALACTNELAVVYQRQGRYEKAEILHTQVLEARHRVLGTEHPDTLGSMLNLAVIHQIQRRYEEAGKLYAEILPMFRRTLGPEHPDTLRVMNNLALVYDGQGRCEEASKLHTHVLEIRRRVLGPEHPFTLRSIHNLAVTYRHLGRSKDAESLNTELLEIRRRTLGPNHPDTVKGMHNLGLLYKDERRYREAEEILAEVVKVRRATLGPEHPDTLISMQNLAYVNIFQGQHEEAENLLAEVLAIRRRTLGPEHSDTLRSMNNIGNVYVAAGCYKQAEELFAQVVKLRETLGRDDPKTYLNMFNLAILYGRQERFAEAKQLMAEVLEVCRQTLGPDHPDTLRSINGLACMCYDQGSYAESGKLFAQLSEVRRRTLGPEHPDTLGSMEDLADAYLHQDRYEEAATSYRDVVRVVEKLVATDDGYRPKLAETYNVLAWLLATPDLSVRHAAEAVALAAKATELMPQQADYWNTLGVAQYRTGDWKMAAQTLEKSMELSSGDQSVNLFVLAMVYRQLGNEEKACHWYDEAVKWSEKNKPDDDEVHRFRREADGLMGRAETEPGPTTGPTEELEDTEG